MKKKTKGESPSLITSHLRGIKRALLDGEKRPAFLEFINQNNERRGIYALYDKRGRFYYVGKASDLPKRLNQHLGDKHSESWDQMTLFFVSKSANIPELEGLVVATAKPPGNSQKPKIGNDMRKSLQKFLKDDAILQINQAIYPEKPKKPDKLSGRITAKKLKAVSRTKLATVLGITQGRISQLFKDEEKKPGIFRKYIREAGRRDGVLLLMQKSKVEKNHTSKSKNVGKNQGSHLDRLSENRYFGKLSCDKSFNINT